MRYNISTEQRNFFQREGLFSCAFLSALQTETLKELLEKKKKEEGSPYNLHLESKELYQALLPSKLGQLAMDLFKAPTLRIAFTTFCTPSSCYPSDTLISSISSLSETCGSAFLSLSSETGGTLTFYDMQKILPLRTTAFPYLVIGFASHKARYLYQPTDPYAHALKKLSYGFGDLISLDTHPLLPFSSRSHS